MRHRLEFFRQGWTGFLVALLLAAMAGAGCDKKPESSGQDKASKTKMGTAVASKETSAILSIHWVGKSRLAQDTNAASVNGVWSMPESERLEVQTLDKLALFVNQLLTNSGAGDFKGWARPLLDDLVREESHIEFDTPATQAREFRLAIRLPRERAELWKTNVGLIVEARSKSTNQTSQIQFSTAGDWTFVAFGARQEGLKVWQERVLALGVQAAQPWLKVHVDSRYFLAGCTNITTTNLPIIEMTAGGGGQNVTIQAHLDFVQPLSMTLPAWTVPTNLIHDPLVSFTVARGIQPLLDVLRPWTAIKADETPNQICAWAVDGGSFQTRLAVNWPNSSNRFYTLSEQITNTLASLLDKSLGGTVTRSAETGTLKWGGVPFFDPFLMWTNNLGNEGVLGGFMPVSSVGRPMPEALLTQATSQTNGAYYDWELTGPRVVSMLQISQLLRMVFGKAQLGEEAVGLKWLQAIPPGLGNSVSTIRVESPTRLTFSRTSTTGLTGVELHLLADWLESPRFPQGLFSSETEAPNPRRRTSEPNQP